MVTYGPWRPWEHGIPAITHLSCSGSPTAQDGNFGGTKRQLPTG